MQNIKDELISYGKGFRHVVRKNTYIIGEFYEYFK
jgi:hypothetical protein